MKGKISSPRDLFFDQMNDVLRMESQLSRHLPDLATIAVDGMLRALLIQHSFFTDRQLASIRNIFERLGREPADDKCKAIAGLIQGGMKHLASVPESGTRDLMVIAHCLRVEHYEIAAYGITSKLAGQLGLREEERVLKGILEEEKRTARELLELEQFVFGNMEAMPWRFLPDE